MTETEWLTSTEPEIMFRMLCRERRSPEGAIEPWQVKGLQLKGPSRRKCRLFTCACCRAAWPLLTDARSRQAVLVAEKYEDQAATEEERHRAETLAGEAWKQLDDAAAAVAYLAGYVVGRAR